MNNLIKKYYGEYIVEQAIELKDKTYLGNPRIKLIFKGRDELELPLEVAKRVVSAEQKDATGLVRARIKPVIEAIQELFTETELTIDEITYMIPFIVETVNMNIDRANEILWGKPKSAKTLLDVDKVLLPKKYEKTKPKD